MSNPTDKEWQHRPASAHQRLANTVRAMRVDFNWLHALWMQLAFSPGLGVDYSVIQPQRPGSAGGRVGYWLWAVVGALALAAVYPLFIIGLATRYYARRLDRLSTGLGVGGVVRLSLIVWGILTAVAYVSPIAFDGFVAVGLAGIVATVSAVLGMFFTRRGGRVSTVLLGYPFGVTGLCLPPVVASLYSPTLASIVFPSSESLAIWLLDNVLGFGGIATFIRAAFELQGLAYVGMWFVLAVPTGWLLGGLVTVVGSVRRPDRSNTAGDARDRVY